MTLPSTSGVSALVTTTFPPGGSTAGSAISCGLTLLQLSYNDDDPFLIGALSPVERQYILNWLFKYASNQDPTNILGPSGFQGGNGIIDYNKVQTFKDNNKADFKLFSHFQVKYYSVAGIPYPQLINNSGTEVGETIDPCFGLVTIAGQKGACDGATPWLFGLSIGIINDGSPDASAVSVFNTLMGKNMQPPLFWESIGSQSLFLTVGAPVPTAPSFIVQNYPTYSLFLNGAFAGIYQYQAAEPSDHFNLAPYPFGICPCPNLLYGTVPGGRCGDAVSPRDPSATIPSYVSNCPAGTSVCPN